MPSDNYTAFYNHIFYKTTNYCYKGFTANSIELTTLSDCIEANKDVTVAAVDSNIL